jgi:periplasmic divalent cation tolerance protein
MIFVYITTSDQKEARKIGRALVESRLAACANILESMNSIYWWDGKVQEATEAVLVVKTRDELMPALVERVRSIHSYDCPCIISLPILGGNSDYLDWIYGETAAGSRGTWDRHEG